MKAAKPRKSFQLTLFVVGKDPNSLLALVNLHSMCAEHLNEGTCTVTIVDVEHDFQAALDNNVLVTPTLLVDGPRGRTTIIGNLSDIDRIILTIGAPC